MQRPVLDAAVEDHVPPVAGPVDAVLRVGEQLADEPLALVGRRVEQEGDDVLGRRDVADDVEPGAAEEGGVVAPRGDFGLRAANSSAASDWSTCRATSLGD